MAFWLNKTQAAQESNKHRYFKELSRLIDLLIPYQETGGTRAPRPSRFVPGKATGEALLSSSGWAYRWGPEVPPHRVPNNFARIVAYSSTGNQFFRGLKLCWFHRHTIPEADRSPRNGRYPLARHDDSDQIQRIGGGKCH